MKSFFLWPRSKKLWIKDFFGFAPSNDQIEGMLKALYPEAEPVLFSSARAGLSAILQAEGLTRNDLVWHPNYSSHCVLESIARYATPTPVLNENVKAALIYHQWGFKHQAIFDPSVIIIEDSVDSLLIPNTNPFLIGGAFALWSLPKVFGTMGGGVVFCRDFDDAKKLRNIRAQRTISKLEKLIRFFLKFNSSFNSYWGGTESLQGDVLGIYRHQIKRALEEIELVVSRQKMLLEKVAPHMVDQFKKNSRYPSNLPVKVKLGDINLINNHLKFEAGPRHFNAGKSCPEQTWEKVYPIPVHIDVEFEDIFLYLKDFMEK